jgi:hypothetical protein
METNMSERGRRDVNDLKHADWLESYAHDLMETGDLDAEAECLHAAAASIRMLVACAEAAEREVAVLEALRPYWAKGYSSDSVAAQVTLAALSAAELEIARLREALAKIADGHWHWNAGVKVVGVWGRFAGDVLGRTEGDGT